MSKKNNKLVLDNFIRSQFILNTKNYNLEFEECEQHFIKLLKTYNIEYKHQRKDAKRAAAAVKKQTKKTNKYQIRIGNKVKKLAKTNVFIHEFMHIFLKHLEKKTLTRPQKEYVVDAIAELVIYYFTGFKVIDYQSQFDIDWQIVGYRNNWIKNANLNHSALDEMQKQIKMGCELMIEYLKFQLEYGQNKTIIV